MPQLMHGQCLFEAIQIPPVLNYGTKSKNNSLSLRIPALSRNLAACPAARPVIDCIPHANQEKLMEKLLSAVAGSIFVMAGVFLFITPQRWKAKKAGASTVLKIMGAILIALGLLRFFRGIL